MRNNVISVTSPAVSALTAAASFGEQVNAHRSVIQRQNGRIRVVGLGTHEKDALAGDAHETHGVELRGRADLAVDTAHPVGARASACAAGLAVLSGRAWYTLCASENRLELKMHDDNVDYFRNVPL